MWVEKGLTICLFCQHCKRIWAGTVTRSYESRKQFDSFNNLECAWCGYRESIAERPEHHNEAINAWAIPTLADREMRRVVEEPVESATKK